MNWVTSRLIHFDRVASCWLISRFIDPDARFLFIEPGSEFPAETKSFGMVGAEIGRHDAEGTTFTKLIRHYKLTDAALHELERIVAAGVAHVMQGTSPGAEDRPGWIAVGLLAIAEGMLAIEDSDDDILRYSLPVWDAVYVEAGLHVLRKSPPWTSGDSDALQSTKFVGAVARSRHAVVRARRHQPS